MARIVVLDSGPLGLVCAQPRRKGASECQAWLKRQRGIGIRVVIPEVADDEVRRDLLRVGSTASLERLDDLGTGALEYQPLTTEAMLKAAELWAYLRRQGMPTGGSNSLDADAIVAAQAILAGLPGDTVTIATTNLRHLGRFPGVNAAVWSEIKA
jgi:predicted nucleic acid-binding protein